MSSPGALGYDDALECYWISLVQIYTCICYPDHSLQEQCPNIRFRSTHLHPLVSCSWPSFRAGKLCTLPFLYSSTSSGFCLLPEEALVEGGDWFVLQSSH